MANEWRDNKGRRPCPSDVVVEITLRNEAYRCSPAGDWDWTLDANAPNKGDIIKWRKVDEQ